MTVQLRIEASEVTADLGRRTIAGTIAPYGVVGNTSAGPTIFAEGSLRWSDDQRPVLVREHDPSTPLGRAVQLSASPEQVRATFRVVDTTAGRDALTEAAEGLRTGLSVGVSVIESHHDDDGQLVVTAAEVDHVGLVVRPAFGPAAQVDHVAASDHTTDPDPDPPATTTEEAAVPTENTPENVGADGTDTTTQPDTVAAAAPEPTVLAAQAGRIQVGADREVESLTAGALLRHQVLAANGYEDSRRLVTAALAADSVSNLPGMVPEARTRDLIAILDNRRPYVDACVSRPLPASGMKITTPKLDTKPLADVIGEGVDVGDPAGNQSDPGGSRAVAVSDDETTVEVIKSANVVSLEVIERSDPSYLDELLVLFAEQYAVRSNTYVRAALVAASAAATAGSQVANGSSWNQMFAKAKADSLGARRLAPNRIGVALNVYEALESEEDADGRPLWNGIGQRNAPGDMGTEQGTIKGTPSFVDIDSADDLVLVFPSDAMYVYEQAGAPAQVRALQVGTMQWEIGMYGFLAAQDRYPAAIRSATIAAA